MAAANMVELMIKLLDCDYPVQWQPKILLEIVPNDMVHRITDQLNEKVFEDDFHFEHLMLYVGLSYEYAVDGRIEEAVQTFRTGENELKEYVRTLPSNMNKAVQHVVSATKAYLLLQQGNLDVAVRVMSDIPAADSMDTENRAALYGLRAVFFDEYGISGTQRALELVSKAIELNPNEPLWYFLKGKYLGRLRRVERPYDIPGAEEIKLLKKASDIRENPSYVVFTAQMYCETANRIYRKHQIRQTLYPSTKLLVDDLNQDSLRLYNKALELKPNCSHMMFRCAKGFIKLLAMICDENLERRTKKILEEGLKIAPENGYGNHVMAQYYERIKKDVIKSIKFLRICERKRIFGAVLDLLRLEYRSGELIDLVQRLTDLLNIYLEKSRKCQVYSQLISYHVFVSHDLEKACKNTYAVMDLDSNCDSMLEHRPICVRAGKTFNLYDVLVDEIKIRLQDEKRSKDRADYYRKFLNDLSFVGHPVSLCKPQNLVKEIQNSSFALPKRRSSAIVKSRPKKSGKKLKIPRYVRVMAQGSHTLHKTDVDQSMNEIFDRCKEAFEKEQEKRYNSHRQTWRSSPPHLIKEERDNSENTEALMQVEEVVHHSREEVDTVERSGESNESDDDDDDDDESRMIIYKKWKENMKQDRHNEYEATADASNMIVPPLKRLGIRDELPKMSEVHLDCEKELKYGKNSKNEHDSNDGMQLGEEDLDDVKTLNNVEDELQVTGTVSTNGNEESESDDDDAFRMNIYRNLKENMKQDHHHLQKATADATAIIVPPLQRLKIGDELPKTSDVHFDCEEELKYLEKKSKNKSDSHDGVQPGANFLDDVGTLNMVEDELHISKSASASTNEESDESDDDTALCMMVHKRSRERSVQTSTECTASTSTDIVQPMKKLKITEQ